MKVLTVQNVMDKIYLIILPKSVRETYKRIMHIIVVKRTKTA